MFVANAMPLRSFVFWAIVVSLHLKASILLAEQADGEANARLKKTAARRVVDGLVVFYDFSSSTGSIVKDRAGVGKPIDLKVEAMSSVRRKAGSLEVIGDTLIGSDGSARRLSTVIRRGGEITIEAWVKPANTRQAGPARIVTLSRNGSNRNVTLGQDGDRYDVRFRTTSRSANGLPSISSPRQSVQPKLSHLVYIRGRKGQAALFLNGDRKVSGQVPGATSNWDDDYKFALANEWGGGRAWRGTYHLVAVYKRDLSPREIEQNFRAGPNANSPAPALAKRDLRSEHFQTKIAPLLAHHCLECHDSTAQQGGLDLSKKRKALAGGDSGVAIVAGNSADSLLWNTVDSDEMPHDRPPLSDREKRALQAWIDDGAAWSIQQIDPAIYAHSGQENQNWLRRLTVPEYIESVKSALGVDITSEARELLPRDLRADGFSNTAYNLNVDLKHVESYARLAEIIVERVDVIAFARTFSKRHRFTDKDMGNLISKMGKRILRGPINEREIIAYRGISTTTAGSGGDYEEAISHILEAMLQSPRFIYRIENQVGDGSLEPVDEYELASRISYIVWGGPPDDELVRAAESGDLFDSQQAAAQVERMLDDSRAIVHSSRFVAEWLNLDRLGSLQPNRQRYPDWNPALAGDMREETLAFFHDVVWRQNRPLADLLNAQVTYATPRLAQHYGLQGQGQVIEADDDLLRYDLTTDPARGGILTQGSLLTVGGDEASMVTRGLLVMHDFLRGVVKDPPPGVNTTPIPTKAGLTQRSIAMDRIGNSNCGGCHAKFEPLAFGLEKFDGLGAVHERDEHGNDLRQDGQILVPGTAKPVPYQSIAELMDLLAKNDRVNQSITWKLTQFALGRPLVAIDAAAVEEIHRVAKRNGGTYRSLLKAIVASDLVQMTRTEVEQVD